MTFRNFATHIARLKDVFMRYSITTPDRIVNLNESGLSIREAGISGEENGMCGRINLKNVRHRKY